MSDIINSDAFKEAYRCLKLAYNDDHVHFYSDKDLYMLTVTKFMMIENNLLRREYGAADKHLCYYGDLDEQKLRFILYFAKYIKENKKELRMPLRHKTVKYRGYLSPKIGASEMREISDALILISFVRNAIGHGHYKWDTEKGMICIDSEYVDPKDGYRLKVDIPIQNFEVINAGFTNLSSEPISRSFKLSYSNRKQWDYLVDQGLSFETFMRFLLGGDMYSVAVKSGKDNNKLKTFIKKVRRKPSLVMNEDTWEQFIYYMRDRDVDPSFKEKCYEIYTSIYANKRGNLGALKNAQHINSYLNGDFSTIKTTSLLSKSINVDEGNDLAVIYNYMIMLFSHLDDRDVNKDKVFLSPYLDFSSYPKMYNHRGLYELDGAMFSACERMINKVGTHSETIEKIKKRQELPSEDQFDRIDASALRTYFGEIANIDKKINSKNEGILNHLRNAVYHCNISISPDGYLIFSDYKDADRKNLTFQLAIKKKDLIELLIKMTVLLYEKENISSRIDTRSLKERVNSNIADIINLSTNPAYGGAGVSFSLSDVESSFEYYENLLKNPSKNTTQQFVK